MATHYPLEGTSLRPRAVAADGQVIRHIGFSDLLEALRLGWEDFKAVPSHAIVLCVIYPVIGILLWRMVLGYSVLPMLIPIAAGFALIGPFAALGLYELSYRRELGMEASAWHAFRVLRAPSFGSMLGLGGVLLAIFIAWVVTAHAIYVSTFGDTPASAIPDFLTRVFTTSEGLRMIMIGGRRRIPVCSRRLVHQPRVVPADAPPARRHDRCHDDVDARGREESNRSRGMGFDRCRFAGDRVDSVLPRPHDRDAVARSCDVASLSQGDREPFDVVSARSPGNGEGKALRGRFPVGLVAALRAQAPVLR